MISPTLLKIGTIEIRWYGLIFALMFLMGLLIALKLAKKKNIDKNHIYNFFIYLVIGSVIMARLFHVFVYNFSYYIKNPIEIFQIWHGGVSIYGGILGAVLVGLYYAKKNNIKFYDLADIFTIPLSFGIIFGRIGNFINQELYGKITNLPWGISFSNTVGKRHPTQIYEAIGHTLIFLFLIYLWKKNVKSGTIFWSFILIYSGFRFFMEFLREGSTVIFNLTLTQIFIIPLFVVSFIMLYKILVK